MIGELLARVKHSTRYVRSNLGDGSVRVKAGEVVEPTHEVSVQDWHDWQAACNRHNHYLSSTDDERPDHPPELASGKRWSFVGPKTEYAHQYATFHLLDLTYWEHFDEDDVIVLREGLELPTHTLVKFVNEAYAVLVLRVQQESTEYHYLHNACVMSADEEESLVQWGVGRTILGNPGIAVAGTLLVAFAEKFWQPAIVGTLLVASASYRVQGVLTKVLRVRSPEWKENKLVPRGIHGTERAMQLVLVVLVALADLMEGRVLLLTALTSASVYVILLEMIGHAVTTWGWKVYIRRLCIIFASSIVYCPGYALLMWLMYVFAGSLFCVVIGLSVLVMRARAVREDSEFWGNLAFILTFLLAFFVTIVTVVVGMAMDMYRNSTYLYDPTWFELVLVFFMAQVLVLFVLAYLMYKYDWLWWSWLCVFGVMEVVAWVASLDWVVADLKGSIQSLQPWRWPLTRAPDFEFTFGLLRLPGLWLGVVVVSSVGILLLVTIFLENISVHNTKARGEKTRARKDRGDFSHYHESDIPSRNLLVPSTDP